MASERTSENLVERLKAIPLRVRNCDGIAREAAAEIEALSKDAKRFQFLQNLPSEEAQAYFWRFESRKQRAEAIDKAIQLLEEQE